MGFSLKRALAGAVVGGAHAAGEVFDAQLKEAAIDRARIADEERARRQAEYADQLLEQREARKQELLDRRETDKRKIYKDTVAEATASLKEKGIKIGSAEGQQAIAESFINAGYPEFGNTFADNAQRAREADDRKELKKIEMANLMETRRAAREARADARESKESLKRSEDFKVADKQYNDILNDLEEKVLGDNGKPVGTDNTVKNWVRNNTWDLSRKDPYVAAKKAAELNEMYNQVKEANPKASKYELTQIAEAEWKSRLKSGEKAVLQDGTVNFNSARGAPQLPSTPSKSSRPDTPIRGIFNGSQGQADEQSPESRSWY